ncbi:MAG: hypothetical protein LAO78_27655 [Acidobacteriia bacterium]|nr:hypothetical protein [Terriglobia bacterium]
MNRLLKLLPLMAMLLFCASLFGMEDKPGWTAKFNGWCCKNLGYGCGATGLITTRKSDPPRPKGGDLEIFDMQTHQVNILWKDCACWSPIPAAPGTLAVLSNAGIWIVPIAKPDDRRLLFPAENVTELLGRGFTSDGAILFLRSSLALDCKFETWALPPGGSAPVKASLAPELACVTDFNFQSIIKPAQVSESHRTILATLFHHGKFEIVQEESGSLKPLFPAETGEDVDRFDPVWINTSSIAFVVSR